MDIDWRQISIEDFWLNSKDKVSFVIYKCKTCQNFRGFPSESFEKVMSLGNKTSMSVLEEAIKKNGRKSFFRSIWKFFLG